MFRIYVLPLLLLVTGAMALSGQEPPQDIPDNDELDRFATAIRLNENRRLEN